MSRMLIGSVLSLSCSFLCSNDTIENGIYALRKKGDGQHIKMTDGADVILAERRGDVQGQASVQSIANDNSRFQVRLKGVGQLDNRAGPAQIALVIDGVCMPCIGQSGYVNGGNEAHDFAFSLYGKEEASKVAKRLRVDPVLRKHLGHRLEVQWVPDQDSYAVGAPITLTMEIRNVGDVAIAFVVGGQQRGSRDNQFRFHANHDRGKGKAIPDTGDPEHFGGLSSILTLKPGQKFTKTVNLDKWFKFGEPDTYRVKGQYELEIHESSNPEGLKPPIWDDFAMGECLIRVVAKDK